MASYLVTGAAGFIGSNLVERLLRDGHIVVGFDNFETGRRSNVGALEDDPDYTFIEGDLRDPEAVEEAVEGVDYVMHQGAVPSVPRSIDDPVKTTEANCVGTTNLLVAARNSDVEKVVVASSSSVYGASEDLPKREDMPVDPLSPYALSKYWTEKLALQFSDIYGLDAVALRYFNVFGPRQDPDSDYAAVIPKFIGLMLEGERPVIYGDGEQSRDFTYVENVVKANLQACRSDCTGEAVNVACGDRVTVNALVEELNDILGTDIEPVHDDPRPGDVRHSLASLGKAREEIGYEPVVDFREGLEKTVDYFRD